ncbi:MAG TPA: Ig-like domain-containing protein, partial [Anaerolineales bacterium]|nr:Ig-like domain-containing protein [Anaerolineales bacterium]
MNKRFRFGCVLLGGIILLLVLAVGGWFWYRSIPSVGDSTPPSPVQVFLLSPSSGAEVKAGDYVPISAKTISPKAILKTELFVDGKSLGTVTDSPEDAYWTWQAFPAGVHTFYAHATDADGNP